MLDMRCNRCKEALAHTVIHLHCGYVMPNHVAKQFAALQTPGGGLEQCPFTAGLAAIAGTRPSQVPSPYQVFICLFNLKKLEKVMLHKGDNPRLAASQTQVNAIGAYFLAC